jgi:ubiquinone/menaquinone biosynthesis C-methylase UbiE
LRTWATGHFARPAGVWGSLAGWVMALRPSNKRRNAWTVDLLELHAGQRVLEIGFGPGLSLARAAAKVGTTGFVAGIDVSDVMLAQATRRNISSIRQERMALHVAGVEDLPDLGDPFDAILAVNSVGFWPDRPVRLQELLTRLAPGGRLAITVQPRSRGATAETSARVGAELEQGVRDAGFDSVESHMLALAPPAVCVIGRRSARR